MSLLVFAVACNAMETVTEWIEAFMETIYKRTHYKRRF